MKLTLPQLPFEAPHRFRATDPVSHALDTQRYDHRSAESLLIEIDLQLRHVLWRRAIIRIG